MEMKGITRGIYKKPKKQTKGKPKKEGEGKETLGAKTGAAAAAQTIALIVVG